MARGESVARQWQLLNILQARRQGASLRDLAQQAGYAARTIQRDLKILTNAGFPIAYEENEFGKRLWRLPAKFLDGGGFVLSVTEAISLHFASRVLAPLAGTTLADGLGSVLRKIRGRLSDEALDHFRGLGEVVLVRSTGRTDHRRHKATIAALSQAVRECRPVELTYRKAWQSPTTYSTIMRPYRLVYFDGDLYVVGYSERAKDIRVFKIMRILAAKLGAGTFRPPADFSLDEHFGGSFGIMHARGLDCDVVVEFAPEVAILIEERQWHPSQKLQRRPDGVIVATYRLRDTVEFKRWLLGFGPHAVVRRPAQLRKEICDTLTAAASRYAPPT